MIQEYYNNIADPGLASSIRQFGENLDLEGKPFISRRTLFRLKIHTLGFKLTLEDFRNLAADVYHYQIIPDARNRIKSQTYVQEGYYFDRVGLDAAFALFYYCRDKTFLENLEKRKENPMDEDPIELWRKKVDQARTGLGESLLKNYLDYPQPPIERVSIARPANDKEGFNREIPPIPFYPSHLKIEAPFLLATNQPFTRQPPFDYALTVAAEYAGVSPERLDEALIAGRINQSSKLSLLKKIVEYLDNFPCWEEYVKTQFDRGIYRRNGTVKSISETALYDNRGVEIKERLQTPKTTGLSNNHSRISMADSYAFWVSRKLGKLSGHQRATPLIPGPGEGFLTRFNTGYYDGQIFAWPLQETPAHHLS